MNWSFAARIVRNDAQPTQCVHWTDKCTDDSKDNDDVIFDFLVFTQTTTENAQMRDSRKNKGLLSFHVDFFFYFLLAATIDGMKTFLKVNSRWRQSKP